MRGAKSGLLLLGVLVFLLSGAVSAQLSRKYDPVVIEGKYLPKALGTIPHNLRLFVWKDGEFKQVPFQIDERFEEMLYWQWTRRRREMVYALSFGDKVKPDPNPYFDANDELAFMAKDLGEKAPEGVLPRGAEVCQEIMVKDSLKENAGFAYLCSFKNPPPVVDTQYVFLGGENNIFIGQTYKIGYNQHQLFFDQLQLGKFPKFGPDVADRFKINYDVYGVYGAIVYTLSNSDINGFLRGIKIGPVRIIKEVVSVTESWPHVQNRLLHHIYYYPYHIEWDMETRAPINWGPLNDYTYSLSLDLSPNVEGSIFLSEKNPVPVVIDGVLDEEELNMDYGPQLWEAVSTKWGTIYNHLTLPLKAKELYPDLYYVDMDQKQDEPEDYFGMMGKFGYTIRHLQKTGRRPVVFRLMYFFSPAPYIKGSEKDFIKIYISPLEVLTDHNISTAMINSLPVPKDTRKPEEKPRATMAPKKEKKQAVRFISPSFMLDPYNTGYGAGISYGDADLFGTGIYMGFFFMATTRNWQDYMIDFQKLRFIPFVEDFRIYFEYQQFPSESFWGIGNESDLDHRSLYWWIKTEAFVTFRKHFADHYGVDAQIYYRNVDIKEGQQPIEGPMKDCPSFEEHFGWDWELEDGERWGGPLYGREGGLTNGITLTFYRDMRDDWQVPHRGDYEAITIQRVGPEFASDYNYTRVTIDLRKYFEPSWIQDLPMDHWFGPKRTFYTKFFGPNKKRNFSFRVLASHTFSKEIDWYGQKVLDVPFYELNKMGGGRTNRGYYSNRFLDNDLFMLTFEYRWQYWRFFDFALFVDAGMVMNDITDADSWDSKWHIGYGGSLRGHLPPGVIATFEYAFSDDIPGGWFVQANWVF